MTDPKGHWSDGGKVWEGRPGGDYQHGYADGIEWATVHAQPASPLRKALQRAYDFLQDKSFMPDALTHECTKVLEQMEEALAAECPLCPGFSTACGNSNCPQLAQPASPLRGRDAEFIARTIALSYGRTPDDMTSVGEMCDGDNRPVPIWMVYEEQADAILSACASPPEQPAADNVKTLLETIDAKNARIGELEEALGKATGRDEVIYECAMVALEQRCQRGTPWDFACTTIAEKIRALSAPSKELPAARPMGQS